MAALSAAYSGACDTGKTIFESINVKNIVLNFRSLKTLRQYLIQAER